MNNSFDIVNTLLLNKYDLNFLQLEHIINLTTTSGIDMSDIYMQHIESETWLLEDGIIKRGNYNVDSGVGIRAISNDKTGFAYTDDICFKSMIEAASSACCIAKNGKTGSVKIITQSKKINNLYSIINPINNLLEIKKINLLKEIDTTARKLDSRVMRVNALLSGIYEVILVFDNDGILSTDIRPLVNLNVSVMVECNGRKEHGSCGSSRRSTYEVFSLEKLNQKCAEEAVRIAVTNLEACSAPAGSMPVVLGAGWPAVMIHEAVGHGLESDFNRKGYSAYTGLIGKIVASPQVSIVDQGNLIGGYRGSLNIDDEGTPTQSTSLIENGILCNYLYDKLNAKLMNTKSTGNGRRSSYSNPVIPRMTNTFMLPGKYSPQEIIESVKKGIYAVNFSGGQVDITSGEFVFSASEAYLINNGQISHPIKGVSLIGNGPKILNKISMVGTNLIIDKGLGTCGKDGQNIPAGVGQPTVKISELTVGGTDLS